MSVHCEWTVRVERSAAPPGYTMTDLTPTTLVVEPTFVTVVPYEIETKIALLDLLMTIPSEYVPNVGWRLSSNSYWVEVEDGV